MLGLLGLVNRARKAAGFEDVPLECLRLKRHIGPVFATPEYRRQPRENYGR